MRWVGVSASCKKKSRWKRPASSDGSDIVIPSRRPRAPSPADHAVSLSGMPWLRASRGRNAASSPLSASANSSTQPRAFPGHAPVRYSASTMASRKARTTMEAVGTRTGPFIRVGARREAAGRAATSCSKRTRSARRRSDTRHRASPSITAGTTAWRAANSNPRRAASDHTRTLSDRSVSVRHEGSTGSRSEMATKKPFVFFRRVGGPRHTIAC